MKAHSLKTIVKEHLPIIMQILSLLLKNCITLQCLFFLTVCLKKCWCKH